MKNRTTTQPRRISSTGREHHAFIQTCLWTEERGIRRRTDFQCEMLQGRLPILWQDDRLPLCYLSPVTLPAICLSLKWRRNWAN
jgi:hypothetical protein